MVYVHLAEQAESEQLNARNNQHRGKDEQRSVRLHHRRAVEILVNRQPNSDGHACKHRKHAVTAEEVQGARKIAKQEADCDQIEEDAESTRNSVMRNAAFAVYVLDGNLADAGPVPRS